MSSPQKPTSKAVENLIAILDLEPIEHNIFRGRSLEVGWQRVFGGLVVSQAMVAAMRTVEDRAMHSLHGYFILAGDPDAPIVYDVDRIRDGGSFTTRRVVAIQHGRAIFSMGASFHNAEEGCEHQLAMPEVPDPDSLPSEKELKERFIELVPENVRRFWARERPIELKPVDLSRYLERDWPRPKEKREPVQYIWFRTTGPLPDDPALHQCALGYASDMTLLDTSLLAHGRSIFDRDLQLASLDHALWFHRPFRADEWLLYAEDSPSAFGARGFNRGSIFTRDGALVASSAQEGLIRKARPEA
ncbi:MAG TPA: acyl-CoA thioesterase II [Hyphomicrobiales bacterium]|nr:acyl-CoA thioesterase II [Hyphomicrobiales bacterium]